MLQTSFEKRSLFEICDFNLEEDAWERLDETFGETMTHDKFFTIMLIDKLTAQLLFKYTLDPDLLVQLDLSTLEIKRTRMLDAEGKECVGDLFFTVKFVDKKARKGRRAVFALIVEHKSDEGFYISIQLLGYVWAWLDYMKDHKEEYADEEGRLPVPYALVFSQDWRESSPKYLNDVTFCAPGCENTVPNFWYRCVRVRDLPFEEIRRCEPLLQGFLYLERLAKNKSVSQEQELDELAQIFGDLCAMQLDARIRRGIVACFNYLAALKKFRPQTTTLGQLINKIEKREGKPMDVSFLEEAFPTQLKVYVADYQKKAEEKYDLVVEERNQARERAEKAEEERNKVVEKCNKVVEERDKVVEERDKVVEKCNKVVEERDRTIQKFKEYLLEQVSKKYEAQCRQTLTAKIQSAQSLDALFDIQRLLQRFNSIEEIEQNLDN